VHLQKQFREMHFVTNGYDYWFAKGSGVNVVDCGMVAVLDYFNCKINGQPFRSLCGMTTVRKRFDKMENIWASLWSGKKEKAGPFGRLKETDVESLIKKALTSYLLSEPTPGLKRMKMKTKMKLKMMEDVVRSIVGQRSMHGNIQMCRVCTQHAATTRGGSCWERRCYCLVKSS
jgi:hypothetical protein